jgi:hypothetical protein
MSGIKQEIDMDSDSVANHAGNNVENSEKLDGTMDSKPDSSAFTSQVSYKAENATLVVC